MSHHIVIGGGISATQAAQTLRHLCPDDDITIITEEHRPFYMRPLLADFVARRIDEDRLWLNFEETAAGNNIRLITGKAAIRIDRDNRTVTLSDSMTLSYDRLLVATGVKPRLPEIPGVELDRVTAFSTHQDALRLSKWCEETSRAMVVGRGLQGVELARALRLRGLSVSFLVPDQSPWFPHLFQVKGEIIEQALQAHEVEVIALDRPAALLGEENRVYAVKTQHGRELPADIVGFATDQRASVSFLVGSGISLADGVVVDNCLRSTDERVFAAGDVAQIEVEDKRRPIGYGWLRAREHGEIAGRNMAGQEVAVEVGDESEAQSLYGTSLLARWH